MDPERVHLPFPTPASLTTPPTTPVRLSKPQSVSSTPDTNHIANSVFGSLEDVLPRLKAELQDRQVLKLSFDDFLRRFITLEDA